MMAPLSEERLAVIRAMITLTDVGDAQFRAITDLLADNDRLRADLAAAREREAAEIERVKVAASTYVVDVIEQRDAALAIVRAVANFDDDDSYDGAYKCHWCSGMYDGVGFAPTIHTPDCLIIKARALLASEASDASESEAE